jgi:predicted nucleotidyltransferase
MAPITMYNTIMIHENLANLLLRLRQELFHLLGERLEAVYLYGSQARGDAKSDSDIDVLVVIQGHFDYFELVKRTGGIAAKLSLEYETVLSLAFVSQKAFEQQKTPFLMNIKQEGVPV